MGCELHGAHNLRRSVFEYMITSVGESGTTISAWHKREGYPQKLQAESV